MTEPATKHPPSTVIYVTSTTGPQNGRNAWRYRPQSSATAAGSIIFSSAGMNLALGLCWSESSLFGLSNQFCYSWFIGVIIGTILSAALRNFVPKKFILAASALLILIEGILFTSVPYNYHALLGGRYINGIGIGLSIVPFLVHASEIAFDSYRGTCLCVEQYSVTFGIVIQMIYSSYWTDIVNFPANRLHGIFDIVFGLSTFLFLFLFFIESPIDYIRNGDDAAALECLSQLKRPHGITAETRALLEQQKAYVREQENLSISESLRLGIVPLVKMLFFRSLMLAFCYSMPLNITFKYSIALNGQIWAATVAGVCRMLGAFIAYCIADSVNRKMPAVISLAFIGGLLIGLSTLFQTVSSVFNYNDMDTAMALYMVIQAFAGFFTPYTSIYMGEAFPLRVKPYLMDVCVIVEQIIQIIFIETITVYIGNNLLVQGIITLVVFLFLCATMPETRNTSLTEAQRRFRTMFYMKSN